MTTTPDFRAELQKLVNLYKALGGNWSPHGYTDTWNDALASARAALATLPPEPPTSQITFNAPLPPKEVIRLDKEGFHYKGQFVADAGEAHRLMVAFLKQSNKVEPEPTELTEPPTDEELLAMRSWSSHSHTLDSDLVDFGRAVLERWGHV